MTTREIERDVDGIAVALVGGDILAAKWGALGLLSKLKRLHEQEDRYHDEWSELDEAHLPKVA